MTDHALASFEAKDGTGRWEVFTWGIIANGQRYHFMRTVRLSGDCSTLRR